jgi:hypothetical protein
LSLAGGGVGATPVSWGDPRNCGQAAAGAAPGAWAGACADTAPAPVSAAERTAAAMGEALNRQNADFMIFQAVSRKP